MVTAYNARRYTSTVMGPTFLKASGSEHRIAEYLTPAGEFQLGGHKRELLGQLEEAAEKDFVTEDVVIP